MLEENKTSLVNLSKEVKSYVYINKLQREMNMANQFDDFIWVIGLNSMISWKEIKSIHMENRYRRIVKKEKKSFQMTMSWNN